jgi:PAS domain S-box-containing protein
MLRLNAELNLPNEPVNMGVWAIVEDSQGRLLIGTERSGVMVFNRRKGSVAPLAKTQPPAGATGSVRVIAEDRRGDLWLGRATELESAGIHFVQVLNRETGRVAEYRNEPGNAASLAPGTIFAIHPDSRDNVWVGTAGGLTCIAADRRTLRTYGPADGLPAEVVASILEDQAGNLWLGTTRGLVRFKGAARQPERLVVNVYDENDGLPGNEFRGGAAFRSRSGEMFFGGPRGVTLFYPDRVRENPFAPPVVLTDLRLFNRSVGVGTLDSPLSAAIWETQALLLQPDQSVLTFEFAALNYTLSRKNRYAYRLEGLEPVWNEAGTRTSATYTSLRHGEYVFRVRAANNDGVWNENGVALRIRVAPRWHERPVVRLGIAACLALAACAGFLWRERQSRRRERELERRVDDRTAELQRLNQELEERVSSRTSELAAEKERLAVTLRSIADAVVATDIEGRVVLVNRVAEELSGWSAAEAWGRPLKEVLPLHDRESRAPLPDPAGSVLRGERVLGLSLEALLVRRDGREILIADSVAPIRDQASRVVGAVLVFRDVTERRRIEEQLQSSEKLEALGVLAGGIAHDFNNLLTGVFGYIDLAQKRDADHEKRHVILNKALAVLNKARGLTGQLLTFSRSEQPVTAPLALGVLIKESVEFALSGANVSCDVHVPDDLWPCRGDEHQIDQVIDNLLLNARQAMPQGGRIDLTASNVVVPDEASVPVADGRYVCIRVQDRGPGIASDLRGRIFEPFFTTKPAGTGLGLATSYSIVRKHGGHIEVESAVGRGSAFCVYLPASSEPVRPRGGASGEAPPRGVGRVLVLDDEDYVRDVAREILEGLGYTVECAATGEEALALHAAAQACSTPFDLVILDLTVPGGMGGVAVLQRMRAVDPRVVAVASSGYSVDSVMTDPGTHGFAGRLTKPYVTAEMGAVVARVLARRQPRSS